MEEDIEELRKKVESFMEKYNCSLDIETMQWKDPMNKKHNEVKVIIRS